MILPIFRLVNINNVFVNIKANLEKKIAANDKNMPEIMLNNIDKAFYDMEIIAREMRPVQTDRYNFNMYDRFIRSLIEDYNKIKTTKETIPENYLNLISDTVSTLSPIRGQYEYFAYGDLGDLNEVAKNISKAARFGYESGWSISDKMLERINRIINCDNRNISLLEFNSCSGENARKIKQFNPNYLLYAVVLQGHGKFNEATEEIKPEEREQMERIITGKIQDFSITPNSFDVVICKPFIHSYFYESDKLDDILEKKTIVKALNAVRRNGLFFCNMFLTRYTSDIIHILSRNLIDMQVLKDETSQIPHIIVAGRKTMIPNKEEATQRARRLMDLIVNDNLHSISEETDIIYGLPANFIEINRFRSSKITDSEMEALYKISSVTSEFWKDQLNDDVIATKKKSMLPFNNGQIGLILTSGCLDGVVEEEDGCAHAIKGRVIKVSDSETEYTNSEEHTTTTVKSNRVEISCFLPDGTYKRFC